MFNPFLLPPLSHLPPPGRVEAARSEPTNYTRLPHRVGSPGHAADVGAWPRVDVRHELRRAEGGSSGSWRASQTGARAKENPCLRKQFRISSAPGKPEADTFARARAALGDARAA